MKLYTSIIEAIKYRTHCPQCKKQLQVNESELAEERFGQAGQKIYVFYLDQRYQSTCEIDTLTSKVKILINDTEDYTAGTNTIYYNKAGVKGYIVHSGKFLHALHVDCPKCHHYGFTLQVHIDLTKCELEGIFLNSEALLFNNGDLVNYEFRNNYSSDKTEFTYWDRTNVNPKEMIRANRVEVPLMNIDFENPFPSVDRIKKLLVFY